ncbi:MAG: hypothetical protein JW902_08430 [Syntrophaceae bacterium]|nr:hypothetical protein [Syntrophaceae bacterium]
MTLRSSLGPDWKTIQSEVQDNAKDYKAIHESILQAASRLSSDCKFYIKMREGSSIPLKDSSSINKKFKEYAKVAQTRLLAEQRRIGATESDDFDQYLSSLISEEDKKKARNRVKHMAWSIAKGHFFKTLVFLVTLSRLSPKAETSYVTLFKRTKPISIVHQGKDRYLRLRPSSKKTKTAMKAIPDIVITRNFGTLSTDNVLSVIECKHRRNLNITDIRQEFGKAFDLGVDNYQIISYYNTQTKLVKAAKQLGIELITFDLHGEEREAFINREKKLEDELGSKIEQSLREASFLSVIRAKSEEVIRWTDRH